MTKVIDLVDDLKRAIHARELETSPASVEMYREVERVNKIKKQIICQVLDEELD